MAQTKRPDAGHIPYMVPIKFLKIYLFYAPILKIFWKFALRPGALGFTKEKISIKLIFSK